MVRHTIICFVIEEKGFGGVGLFLNAEIVV
jgi:hypothetical protein